MRIRSDIKFEAFLEVLGIKEQFVECIDPEWAFLLSQTYKVENTINVAFGWSETPQGHDYWETIHEDLEYFLGRMKDDI